eukprot:5667507-Pyramimonas_sp.AAC.1
MACSSSPNTSGIRARALLKHARLQQQLSVLPQACHPDLQPSYFSHSGSLSGARVNSVGVDRQGAPELPGVRWSRVGEAVS